MANLAMANLYDIVDSILGPVQSLLEAAISYLVNIQLVAARGIDLNYYLGWVGVMGPGWAALVMSVIASLFLLATVFVSRSVYNLYLGFKHGVKWW